MFMILTIPDCSIKNIVFESKKAQSDTLFIDGAKSNPEIV